MPKAGRNKINAESNKKNEEKPNQKVVSQFENKAKRTDLAELAYLVQKFDPALLFHIGQGIEHGISLITEWLPKYKFKDWKKTATQGKDVTDTMKKNQAEKIAATLGDASKWHSHGRGIPMNDLSGSDIRLLIDDFGTDDDLSDKIKNYHGLAVDYFSNKLGWRATSIPNWECGGRYECCSENGHKRKQVQENTG